MQQKQIYLFYLIVGISLLTSCGKGDIDYNVRADFIFINETDYDLKYQGDGDIFNVNSNSSIKHTVKSGGSEKVNENSFQSPLHTYCYPCIIDFNNIKCDTITDNGPAEISNFTSKQISDRHIEYTYRFTNEYLDTLEGCN